MNADLPSDHYRAANHEGSQIANRNTLKGTKAPLDSHIQLDKWDKWATVNTKVLKLMN